MNRYLLGYDIGSSSVKASVIDSETGNCVSSAFYPKTEAPIISLKPGWAEQEPSSWWKYLKESTADILKDVNASQIAAIGISYQMHGLVCVDKNLEPLRPAIIWCDSRAVPYGKAAFDALGHGTCLDRLKNSPGNFTASKLAWVKENEPDIFERTYKIMLPGDYIAMKLSGEVCTTVSGLSEGMLWDFDEEKPAYFLMRWFGFPRGLLPDIVPTFSIQGKVCAKAASELGLRQGTPICYRAGDQPNNALSLNVLEPGEIAATAGTSGVVYGVNSQADYDTRSRVNTFAHVNHSASVKRLGVLLCINGTGILNSWLKHNVVPEGVSYSQTDAFASQIPVGCEGLTILPFGNGAERMLCNRTPGCSISGLDFNRHNWKHLARAAQEGIAFSFKYGIDIMAGLDMNVSRIHAGKANMFLSPVFREAIACTTGATIELMDTDGAAGAARGAGIGAGIYGSPSEAFSSLKVLEVTNPDTSRAEAYAEAYGRWETQLQTAMQMTINQ